MDTGDVRSKFESFGWDSVRIDSHDMSAIVEALERSRTWTAPPRSSARPEGPRRLVHGGSLRLPRQAPSQEQAEEALQELEATLDQQTKTNQRRQEGPRS